MKVNAEIGVMLLQAMGTPKIANKPPEARAESASWPSDRISAANSLVSDF